MTSLSDKRVVYSALHIWANYIETGNPATTNNDLLNMDKKFRSKVLTQEQQEFVIRLRKMAADLLS